MLGEKLEALWPPHQNADWRLEENAGPFAMQHMVARVWLPARAGSYYAWLYFRPQDASALVVSASRGSMLLQSLGGANRIIVIERGVARAWVGDQSMVVMEHDRLWIGRDLPHLIEPLTQRISFELIYWPEVAGASGHAKSPTVEQSSQEG